MTKRPIREPFAPEVRERAVRVVRDQQSEHPTQWATIQAIAPKIGCSAEALRTWVRRAEMDAGERPGLTTDERERLKALEREKRELKRAMRSSAKRARFSPRRSSTASQTNRGRGD